MAVFCAILGALALAVLQFSAAVIAVLTLVVFAFGWSIKSIKWTYKIGFIAFSLILVFSVDAYQVHSNSAALAERERVAQEAKERQREDELRVIRQVENAFRQMTPEQHLAVVKKNLRVDASPGEIDDAMRNLEALNGTPLEGQGEAIRAHYAAQKDRAEKLAAAEEKRDAAIYAEAARTEYAKALQSNLYDEYMDAKIDAIGPQHTVLRITWALASDMTAYQMSKKFQTYFQDMRQLGFRRFVLTDGFGDSWGWNLDK